MRWKHHGESRMTLNEFQRAKLAEFAVRQAGPRGSVEQMKAICYVIRNRVRKGWSDGNWIGVIESAGDHAAHDEMPMQLDPNDRNLQRMVADVDEIFYGNSFSSGDGAGIEDSLTQEKHEALYWSFANRPVRPWFLETIQKDQANHPMRTQMGTMMFYE